MEAELVKKNEERIQALQDTRRQAEIRREEEAKKQKRERERDMMVWFIRYFHQSRIPNL